LATNHNQIETLKQIFMKYLARILSLLCGWWTSKFFVCAFAIISVHMWCSQHLQMMETGT